MQNRYDDKDDKELLQLFYKDGNNDWLGILLQRYTAMLLGVSLKYLKNEEDAKDSVQQIFLKVISELQKYRVDYFKSWLYMIAKNHCLMKLRDRHKQPVEIKDNFTAEETTDDKTPQEKEATLTHLEEAITKLNEEQRICISLFYFEKKSYQEITALTAYPLMQVKSNIQNGKRNLKIYLQRMTNHE